MTDWELPLHYPCDRWECKDYYLLKRQKCVCGGLKCQRGEYNHGLDIYSIHFSINPLCEVIAHSLRILSFPSEYSLLTVLEGNMTLSLMSRNKDNHIRIWNTYRNMTNEPLSLGTGHISKAGSLVQWAHFTRDTWLALISEAHLLAI